MANAIQNTGGSGGIGFIGLLQLLFIGLKLGHVIFWPWLTVFLPFIIGITISLVLILVLTALASAEFIS